MPHNAGGSFLFTLQVTLNFPKCLGTLCYLGFMKALMLFAIGILALLFAACAPSTVAPGDSSSLSGSGSGTTSVFLPTALSARVSQPGVTALGIKADSIGLGFEVTDGPWGFEIKVPPRTGIAMRGSYVEGSLVVGLNVGWETYDYSYYNGPPNFDYQTRSINSGGVGLDLGYFFPISLQTAQGYVGPRLYTYVLCESQDNNPLKCVGPRFNPGATIGVNAKLGERFMVSPEITALLLPPDAKYASPRGATVFGISMSYRF